MSASKALEEVWRWKDAVYQDTKDTSCAELIRYLQGVRRRLEEKTGIQLDLPRGRPRERAARRDDEPR